MRVLHVTSTFPKADGDPTGPFLADLVAAERVAGLDVRVVAPHAPGLAVRGLVAGVGVRRFRYGPDRMEVLAYRGGLLAAARRPGGAAAVPAYLAAMVATTVGEAWSWQPDVIHAHWWFPAGVAAAVASRLTGVPSVVTLHGSDVALSARPGARPSAGAVLRAAAGVFAVSEALADEVAAVTGLPRSAIAVAPMPVVVADLSDPDSPGARVPVVAADLSGAGRPGASAPVVADEPPPGASGGPSGRVKVVTVGRLVREKGLDVLIDALAGMNGVAVDCEVIGDGPERGALEERARRAGLAVAFAGALPRAELYERLRGAAALVVPSRREGLGLVAVEAVLLGVPVIASHTGGLPGALGDPDAPVPPPGGTQAVPGGLLVRAGDVAALTAALGLAGGLTPPAGAALSAAERHRPGVVAARHEELYAAAIERSRRRGRGGPR